MIATQPSLLIAIVGGSGAGKGWVVERLCRLLGERAAGLQLDDFYRDRSDLPLARRARLNFDVPQAIDWESAVRTLRECRAGLPTRVPRYDFATYSRVGDEPTWLPRPVVFVDGLWLLHPPEVRELFDLTIYLDTPPELRRQRRLTRDVSERGYCAEDVERRLRTAVAPMHNRYVEPQKKHADLVLAQPFAERELLGLAGRLWTLLSRAQLVEPWMHETFRAELLSLLANHEHRN
ncbi:MAG TPA: uridine-cytidine kinase [Opitutaceae bacterium]|nr:uridine-cytidine kinase [Opitutaceae bacterium]